jgi:Ca-activated chloride channel family protein
MAATRSTSPSTIVAFALTAGASLLPWITGSARTDRPGTASSASPTTAALGAAPAPPSTATAAPVAAPAPPPADAGPVRLHARLDRGLLPLTPGGAEAWLVVTLEPTRPAGDARLPVNLAIVLDVSGSMAGAKLAEAKKAASALVALLHDEDRAALVAYEAKVDVKVPSTPADPAGKARLLAAIGALRVHGETNIESGLLAGRDEVLRFAEPGFANRVVLLSDGMATRGTVRDADGLATLARSIYDDGVAVTAVGVGLDAKVDLLMGLARQGGGGYHYVEGATALADIFVEELRAAGSVVARAPWVDITPAPGVDVLEFVGLDAERIDTGGSARYRVRPGDLYDGVERKIVVRVRVPAGTAGAARVASVLTGYREATAAETAHVAVAEVATLVVPDLAASEASRDPDATDHVVAAELARDLEAAADLHAHGARPEALARIRAARARVTDELARGLVSTKARVLPGKAFDALEAAAAGHDASSEKRFFNDSSSAAYDAAY